VAYFLGHPVPKNDVYCVGWGVKFYSLTYSLKVSHYIKNHQQIVLKSAVGRDFSPF